MGGVNESISTLYIIVVTANSEQLMNQATYGLPPIRDKASYDS